MLGVLGGTGPLATSDFLEKLVKATPALKDQEHPQVVVFSNPKIPDRIGPILYGSEPSPLPALVESAQRLQGFGATTLVMPCHTAHYWHAQIARRLSIPFLHIADVTCELIGERAEQITLLSTQATLHAGFYQERFDDRGIPFQLPEQSDMDEYILPAIAAVKGDDLILAAHLFEQALHRLTDNGTDLLVPACTELLLILEHVDSSIGQRCIDPTQALAEA